MMYETLIRFKLIKENKNIEVYLDSRLSFIQNFHYLEKLIGIKLDNSLVYDPNKKIFLDRNIPLDKFKIEYFINLYLFN